MEEQIERDIAAIRLKDKIREVRAGHKRRKLSKDLWGKILRLAESYSLEAVSSFLEVSTPGIRRHQKVQGGFGLKPETPLPVPDPVESWVRIPLEMPPPMGNLRGSADIVLELGFAAYGPVRIELNQAGCLQLAHVLRGLRQ